MITRDNIIDLSKMYYKLTDDVLLNKKIHRNTANIYSMAKPELQDKINEIFKLLFDGHGYNDIWNQATKNKENVWDSDDPTPKHLIGITTVKTYGWYLMENRKEMSWEEKQEITDKFLELTRPKDKEELDFLELMFIGMFGGRCPLYFIDLIFEGRKLEKSFAQ